MIDHITAQFYNESNDKRVGTFTMFNTLDIDEIQLQKNFLEFVVDNISPNFDEDVYFETTRTWRPGAMLDDVVPL